MLYYSYELLKNVKNPEKKIFTLFDKEKSNGYFPKIK